jgi:hypothetical protein
VTLVDFLLARHAADDHLRAVVELAAGLGAEGREILRHLAAPFEDHPDFEDRWYPEG